MKLKFTIAVLAVVLTVMSCRRENESFSNNAIKEWFVPFSATYANPATPGRVDSGTAHIILYQDSSIRYDFRVPNLQSGDALTGVTFNAGDPITNGPVLRNLQPRISNNYVSGGVFHLSPSLMDSLLTDMPLYINVTSSQNTNGLLRGQLNENIALAANVALSGANEVPPVNTTATGTAVIRVTADRTVYSNVTVTNVEPADQLTMAHIHVGAAGQNGPIIVPLASSASDFNQTRTFSISSTQYDSLVALPLYVNVHSQLSPAGKIRGQIK